MRVYQINVVCGNGSTGRIAADISRAVTADGGSCRIAYGRGTAPKDIDSFKISNRIDLYYHAFMTRLTDKHGLYSKGATKRLINDIRKYNPDIIHLHNIHGYYLNYEMLFAFLKEYGKIIKWTLHDCWSFTGHCTHFTAVGCDQWKDECRECCQLKRYPACNIRGNVRDNFQRKKAAFTNVPNLELTVPSRWLADRVKQSFLGNYPVEVVYNPIDTDVFHPVESDFREKYRLQNKCIVLGVANVWDEWKGFYDMLTLAEQLDERYAVVMVGLTKKQIKRLPKNILGLERTTNTKQLAEIYSTADVFLNPSVEETFGLTTVEAIACGTPAIVYKGTACEEIAEKCGGIAISKDKGVLLEQIKKGIDNFRVFDINIFSKEIYQRKMLEILKQ